jgi:uncharacterized membrane protein
MTDFSEKKFVDFVKNTVMTGFFVLLPVLVVLGLIGWGVAIIFGILKPIMDVFAIKSAGGMAFATLGGILLFAVGCFLTGFFVRLQIGKMTQEWVEEILLAKVPGYTMFKNLTQRLSGQQGLEFTPALVDLYGTEAWAMGFIVEEAEAGQFTVFVPVSPMPTVGQVYLLPESRVRKLDARLVDVVNSLTQWGEGSGKLLRRPLNSL